MKPHCAMVRKDKCKTTVHVLYQGYQYSKDFFLSEFEAFYERSNTVAVATFLLC